jgi:hypothetical protein
MLDLLLALYLLLILSGLQLRKSLRKRRKSDKAKFPRTRLYWKNTVLIAAPLAVLALASWLGGRPLDALGLGLPLSTSALWGLLAAALVLAGLLAWDKNLSPAKQDEKEALGFLVSYLMPYLGLAGAVALPTLAYAAAHGYNGARQFGVSIIFAFLFTIGFALTNSLWWLMLVHAGLPLLAALTSYKMLKQAGPAPAAA